MESIAIIHVAGPMVDKIQRCIRCGTTLVDYTKGKVMMIGSGVLLSWPQDFVTVDGVCSFAGQGKEAVHCNAAVQ